MIKQGVCLCALLTVVSCMNVDIQAIEVDSRMWNSFQTSVEDIEINYKLPPNPNSNVKSVPETSITFENQSSYSVVGDHKWSRIGSFGYEYDQSKSYSHSRFELTMLIGRVGASDHDFVLGSWLFDLRTKAGRACYFSSFPKEKGRDVLFNETSWYHEVGYKLIEPTKSTKTSNVIISDLYAKMLNSDTYVILAFEYIEGVKGESHPYRRIAQNIVSNVWVENGEGN